ncbi:hypothetical protein [Streptomyces sp. SID3343]|uniref:hypothetical protein n=1 Tax=Streptomyces sp. SID3343 TaxID=2690260 RepID=UPI001370625D|nr:hypothetical protein [Streptomyces sp. SID3343]MYW06583.1 hypothetical protein [Streptomyces sp. SID3343]
MWGEREESGSAAAEFGAVGFMGRGAAEECVDDAARRLVSALAALRAGLDAGASGAVGSALAEADAVARQLAWAVDCLRHVAAEELDPAQVYPGWDREE